MTEYINGVPVGNGGGDMTKAVYDANEDDVVDDSEKLEASTKAQVQDHTPKAHTLDSHSTKAHSELSDAPEGAHHTKFTTTEHSSIGNGAPHHTKYTDSSAKAAAVRSGVITNGETKAPTHDAVFDVKTTADAATTTAEATALAKLVKLDDFATPDVNTDLDFSTARHGLVPQGTNVGDFLKDDGTWGAAGGGGAAVATGTYTGNAGANRQITTGFKCSMVILLDVTASQLTIMLIMPDGAIAEYAASNKDLATFIEIHASDGFTVGLTEPTQKYAGNRNTDTYTYWAISE